MIDAGRLLGDLKRLRKKLEEDLRCHHAASPERAAVEAEWREARETKRTADTFETFFGNAIDQSAVHWILALVFLRFLEDNRLLDRPIIGGPGERLEMAQLRQRDWFRTRPEDSDAEYLLAMFGEVACLPGLAGLFDPGTTRCIGCPFQATAPSPCLTSSASARQRLENCSTTSPTRTGTRASLAISTRILRGGS